MSANDADSMWLQKSITIPDPMPDVTGTTPAAQRGGNKAVSEESDSETAEQTGPEVKPRDGSDNVEASALPATVDVPAVITTSPNPPFPTATLTPPGGGEMELTKMLLDTSSLVVGTASAASRQHSSVARYSTARMSMANAASGLARDYDELRLQFSQAKRELLKVSDVQKDLDYARFELTRAQEERNIASESNRTLRRELDAATEAADRAVKDRTAAVAAAVREAALLRKETAFLAGQVDELRQENTQRLAAFTEQQESETQRRIQAMREELAAASQEMQAMTVQMDDLHRERDRLAAANEAALADRQAADESAAQRENRIADLKAQLNELQEQHRQFATETQQDRDEAVRTQQALADQRAEQITRSKDACIDELKEEVGELKERCRTAGDDAAQLRHANHQLTEEVRQLAGDHGKELRRLAEAHRLSLCEKELQLESALREAKGNRAAVGEEGQSLRRQLAKVSEELSTVAAVLAQREKQLAAAERDGANMRERALTLEQDNVHLANHAEMNEAAVEEANGRVRRLDEQKDSLEEAFSADLSAAKERARTLEAAVMEARDEVSLLRRERLETGDKGRAETRDLRSELDAMTEERDRLAQTLNEKADAESTAEGCRKRFSAERQKTDALTAELSAAMSRCTMLEKRLDDELRRAIIRAVATTSPSSQQSPIPPMHPRTAGGGGQPHRTPAAMRLRSASSANARGSGSSSCKRARTEDARVFAISGFDGSEMLTSIKQLPNVAIAECQSNTPVPSNLTHLISNGILTVKLLTALVRGCWVLPEAYVVESLKERTWLSERDYGFQHEDLPLLKRRVFITDAFASCKNYSTACMLLREGGAIVSEDATPKESDYVLCNNSEVAGYEDNGLSWEKMVQLIYPVRVG